MDIYFQHNPIMDIADIVSARLSAWMSENQSLNTIKKVEKKSGVGFGTIRRAKNGDGNITIEKLAAIAEAFDRHPSELLINRENPYPENFPAPIANRPLSVREPEAPNIVAMPPPLLTELIKIAGTLSEAGLHRLIERAKQLSEEHPKALQQKDA